MTRPIITRPARDVERAIEAARVAVDAYVQRFETRGGRLFGPIDTEIEALRRALGPRTP